VESHSTTHHPSRRVWSGTGTGTGTGVYVALELSDKSTASQGGYGF